MVADSVPGYSLDATSIQQQTLDMLRNATDSYLLSTKNRSDQFSAQFDSTLDTLVQDFTLRWPSDRLIAIFACLHLSSAGLATTHILSIRALDAEQYLTCLLICDQIRPAFIPPREIQIANSLNQVIRAKSRHIHEFGLLVERFRLMETRHWLDSGVVEHLLARYDIAGRMWHEINVLLENRRLHTLYGVVAWRHSLPADNAAIMSIINSSFPHLPWILTWRPHVQRIKQWEEASFAIEDRRRLERVFDFDGPDVTSSGQQSKLSLAARGSYKHVPVQPETPETHEKLLQLLSDAQRAGQGMVKIFIQLCVENCADEKAMSMVRLAIENGDSDLCDGLSLIYNALYTQKGLSNQIGELAKALSTVKSGEYADTSLIPLEQIVQQVESLLDAAQTTFREQLQSGTGEFVGMLISDLKQAVLKAVWLHKNISPQLLARLVQIPSEDVLEATFKHLYDAERTGQVADARFKDYLASTLGGQSGMSASAGHLVSFQEIQVELEFWKTNRSSTRRDLAKIISGLEDIPQATYISCLPAIIQEDDTFIEEIKHILASEKKVTCFQFSRYIARRRRNGQLLHDCWIMILGVLIQQQGQDWLPHAATRMVLVEWLGFIKDMQFLLGPIQSQLSLSWPGLTPERLDWWGHLSKHESTIQFLVEQPRTHRNIQWLYFPSRQNEIQELINLVQSHKTMPPTRKIALSYLDMDGNNVVNINTLLRSFDTLSDFPRAAFDRVVLRAQSSGIWPKNAVGALLRCWARSAELDQSACSAFQAFGVVLQISRSTHSRTHGNQVASQEIERECKEVLQDAEKLERLRWQLQRKRPKRVAALLKSLDIMDSMHGRHSDLPESLIDAVEVLSDNEYEITFPLTDLGEIQLYGRGITKKSRILRLRIRLDGKPAFCVHTSAETDSSSNQHYYWDVFDDYTNGPACSQRPSLLSYYLSQTMIHLLKRSNPSLQTIHKTAQELIDNNPSTCLVCAKDLKVTLWKPSTCSKACSKAFRRAPLEVRLHNLLVDPSTLDLLLTSLYLAVSDPNHVRFNLLQDCPIPTTQLVSLIDSFPALSVLAAAKDLPSALYGTDGLGSQRELLLSWICIAFRGFMMKASDRYKIHGMANTEQFLMLNSHHERESLFAAQSPNSPGGVVFHGTQPARLFSVLTQGLKVMSHTAPVNGASYGAGIYCADEPATSNAYAGAIVTSWKHSALNGMRVMLGCELAGHALSSSFHVIPVEDRLLVRYVFLLSATFVPPARAHVEPAMASAYSTLRTGLAS
ncbi:hypothetical protein BT63DRAFT_371329 [Microthyrium microscopicum]|uniref:PARP catalytic domain-containing protein n=1 Tax=Microthyrium microscopicum TaxID=703497 RepID=A0A6A6UH04_9PEZI|nr:hypothetical protein BT63DRAFT_371329 [Microthyrium microscopicum]